MPKKTATLTGIWELTSSGMKAKMPGVGQDYHIDAKRFLESHDEFYEWPLHMAEKTWVNIEEFNAAFRQALAAHAGKYKGELDNAKLEASFRQAVRLKANP